MASGNGGRKKAFDLLRALPRLSLNNIKNYRAKHADKKRARGQHGGKTHGCGTKGSKQRQNFMRVGYETGNTPFYIRVPCEPYYQGHHMSREYFPLSLLELQLTIDTNRLSPDKPIDLTTLCNTKLFRLKPLERQFGFQLTADGADKFKAKLNIEVQRAPEPVIAAIEKNGGVITTAHYDIRSLMAKMDPLVFFMKGKPIPKRLMPCGNYLKYYTDPLNRGYLADPEEIALERLKLAQKYGYTLPDLEEDAQKDMLLRKKDPRQVFYGLEPGWIINLKNKSILKPKNKTLLDYYKS